MPLRADTLPYRKPELGKHYWIKDNILPDPFPVVERCFNKTEWTMGAPWRPEAWPGMRSPHALMPEGLGARKSGPASARHCAPMGPSGFLDRESTPLNSPPP